MVKTVNLGPPSLAFDVMTQYVKWQRQNDVTYVKICLVFHPIVTDIRLGYFIIKEVLSTEEKRQEVVPQWRPRVNLYGALITSDTGILLGNYTRIQYNIILIYFENVFFLHSKL